jgi:hypothetical protein
MVANDAVEGWRTPVLFCYPSDGAGPDRFPVLHTGGSTRHYTAIVEGKTQQTGSDVNRPQP